ncbi:MAG: hypothetical protein M3Z20_08340 [Chloroflexota bacterium]|nr:hypothetical protein [Chloroflexota bacterium]
MADHDWLLPELAGTPVFSTNTAHQRFVHLADQTQTDGHAVQEFETKVESLNVVSDFMYV